MIKDIFPKLKSLILDLDGVIWRDSTPIGDLPAIFSKIYSQGLKVIFATNNATKTIEEYQHKLQGFGLSIKTDQIINSSLALGIHLSKLFPKGGNVFVVGENSLKKMMSGFGFTHLDDFTNTIRPIAVIAALDYSLTYEKIKIASLLIRSGTPFFGTNSDVTYPTPHGLWPGAGTIVKAIETASQTDAIVIGKPSPMIFQVALERLATSPQETMVIGDRFETDIVGGQASNCLTGLVLSGVSNIAQADQWVPKPDIICPDLDSLISC